MQNKKTGLVFISLGAVLIVSALLLLIGNQQEDAAAGAASDAMLEEVLQLIQNQQNKEGAADAHDPEQPPLSYEFPEENSGEAAPLPEGTVSSEEELVPEPEMLEGEPDVSLLTTLSAKDYAGILSMPTLNVTLPVLADWSYEKLKAAPCRQFGSTAEDDLVIAAHNYRQHFGKLGLLNVGDAVQMTDMDGTVNEYVVKKVGTLAETAVEEVQDSGYALVLYTCTYSGSERIVVFCGRR